MELASQIQRGILPRQVPQLPGWEIAGWTRPSRHVGGDYYDLMPLPDGNLVLLVADVSGKGVPAALLVSTLHASLRLLLDRGEPLEDLLRRVNKHLLDFSASNKFVTLFLAELEPRAGVLRYLNAGHNPALLVRTDGAVEELRAGGVPLGLLPRARYAEAMVEMAPGDLLCLYSDGVTEAASHEDEEFGAARLAEVLVELRARPLAEVRATLLAAVTGHAEGLPQADDQTVVLLRRQA